MKSFIHAEFACVKEDVCQWRQINKQMAIYAKVIEINLFLKVNFNC